MRAASLFNLAGRTALITGGNSGIGLAIARALGLAGASVLLVARRAGELADAAAGLSRDDIAARALSCVLADAAAIDAFIVQLREQGAPIDILVNAAGINLRQPFAEVSAANFDLHTALHLRAPFLLTQALAPAMASRGWGAF
jgi:gluconate 5-dehydrogenase